MARNTWYRVDLIAHDDQRSSGTGRTWEDAVLDAARRQNLGRVYVAAVVDAEPGVHVVAFSRTTLSPNGNVQHLRSADYTVVTTAAPEPAPAGGIELMHRPRAKARAGEVRADSGATVGSTVYYDDESYTVTAVGTAYPRSGVMVQEVRWQ